MEDESHQTIYGMVEGARASVTLLWFGGDGGSVGEVYIPSIGLAESGSGLGRSRFKLRFTTSALEVGRGPCWLLNTWLSIVRVPGCRLDRLHAM